LKRLFNLFKSNFVKNVAIIAGGTAFAQALNTVLTPIVTRIYTPEEYGILTVYTSTLSILSPVASLRYEWAITIADDDEIAANTLYLSAIVLLAFTGILSVILLFWGDSLLSILNGNVLNNYRNFIPLGIIFIGLYNIFRQWSFRNKNFKDISKTKLSQTLAKNLTNIILGLFGMGPIGLILGNIFGQSAGITTLSLPFFKNERHLFHKVSIQKIRYYARRYIKFPVYSAPSQFFNSAGIHLPSILMTSLYGSQMVGYYGLTSSIINLPMVFIGNSIGDVFYGEAASIGRRNPRRLKQLSSKLFKKLFIIGLAPLLTLVFFGPFLFSFVFGETWYQAGVYARIMAVLVFARLIFTPISRLYSVFERQKEAFFLDLFRVILVLLVFWISSMLYLNSYFAVGLYTIAMSIVYLTTYLLAQRIINQEINKKRLESSVAGNGLD
jgi:O-antigen/teichoic acid export membrane protein